MQYQLKYGDKCINIYAALRDVRKNQKTMAKYYGCLSRPDERDDDFYKALLRVDEQMVSHLCGFFQCSCVLQEREGIICCKKHVKDEGFDTRVAYSVRGL